MPINFYKTYSFLILFLALVGVYINYSPIPIADSWSNYELVTDISEGHLSSFISLHNEHRILPSKILFWLDMHLFGGSEIFILIIHILFIFMIFKLFSSLSCENNLSEKERTLFPLFILSMLFFWSQKANLTWAFQSQFFLVQIFSLLTFLSIKKKWNFIFVIIFSIFSVLSMGNGLLIPILVTFYYVINKNFSRASVFLLLTIGILFFYFIGYQGNPSYMSPIQSVTHYPLKVFLFIFVFLGNIFSFLVGKGIFGAFLAGCMGFLSILFVLTKISKFHKNPIFYYLIFLIGTAVIVGLSRHQDGYLHAVSSRYTTPTIYYWITFVILFFSDIKKHFQTPSRVISWVFIFILISFFVNQLKVFREIDDKTLKRYIDLAVVVNNHGNILPHMNYDLVNNDHIKNKFLFSRKIIRQATIPAFSKTNNQCDSEILKINFLMGKNDNYSYVDLELNSNTSNVLYVYKNEKPSGVIASKSMFKKLPFIEKESDHALGYIFGAELDNYIIMDHKKDCFIRLSKNIDE
jgi:hypothetical protein